MRLKFCLLETVAGSLKTFLKVSSYTFYCTFSAQNLDTKEGGKKSHGRSLMGNFGKHKVSGINESSGCCSGTGSIPETLPVFYGSRQAWWAWGQRGGSLCDHTWCLNSVLKIENH